MLLQWNHTRFEIEIIVVEFRDHQLFFFQRAIASFFDFSGRRQVQPGREGCSCQIFIKTLNSPVWIAKTPVDYSSGSDKQAYVGEPRSKGVVQSLLVGNPAGGFIQVFAEVVKRFFQLCNLSGTATFRNTGVFALLYRTGQLYQVLDRDKNVFTENLALNDQKDNDKQRDKYCFSGERTQHRVVITMCIIMRK